MTACAGCGSTLGFKKFKFHRMWRIPGYYCKSCMIELGREFDEHAKITIPKKPCDLCGLEFYYLKPEIHEHKKGHYCDVCHKAVKSGVIPDRTRGEVPKSLPAVIIIFAGLGLFMMLLGLLFTLSATSAGESNIISILFGAVTTAFGFIILRKAIRSRALLMARRSTGAP